MEKNKGNICPVCGKFTSKFKVLEYEGLMAKAKKADARLETNRCLENALHKLRKEYQALVEVCDRQRVEIARYENMSWWDRVFRF